MDGLARAATALAIAAALPATAPAAVQAESPDESPAAVAFAAHEALPEGDAADLAQMYWSASEVPGIDALPAAHRRSLLDVVTERYRSRLVDRGPGPEELRRHVERLAASPLASRRPLTLAQTCAQYGFAEGACAPHEGYVRRAMVLDEMLAAGRLGLGELETELAGGARPSLREQLSSGNEPPGTADRRVSPANSDL